MKFNPCELADFARYYGFHYDNLDEEALVRDFVVDMRRGLRGERSSMPMIPSWLRPVSRVPAGKAVVALDAGGTNLRAARVVFDEAGRPLVSGLRKAPMPGTRGRLSRAAFFDSLAEVCAPLIEEAGGAASLEGIGFCFSYPMEMTSDGDGLPMAFSKEIDAPEVVGTPVGKGLREALAKRGVSAPERIALLNDTVSTLLTGITSIPPRCASTTSGDGLPGPDRCGLPAGPVMGLILGTGFNTAYPEVSIPKIDFHAASAAEAQVVVAESGTYFNRYQGRLDKVYDATTKNPGAYGTEKTCSGAYLGPLTLTVFKQALADGLVSFARAEELAAMPALQTRDLNAFLQAPLALEGPLGGLFAADETDAIAALGFLSGILTERAALFAAAIVAGTVEQMDAGWNPSAPVRIAVEGTTYLVFGHLRRALEARLHVMLNRAKPRAYIIAPVEQASLLGAAVAALSR